MAEYEKQRATRTGATKHRYSQPTTPLSARIARASGGRVRDRPRAMAPSVLERPERPRAHGESRALPSPPATPPSELALDAGGHGKATTHRRRVGRWLRIVLSTVVVLGVLAVVALQLVAP